MRKDKGRVMDLRKRFAGETKGAKCYAAELCDATMPEHRTNAGIKRKNQAGENGKPLLNFNTA